MRLASLAALIGTVRQSFLAFGGLPLIVVARVETGRRVSSLLLAAYMEGFASRASAVHSIVLTYIMHTGCILRCTVHMLWI